MSAANENIVSVVDASKLQEIIDLLVAAGYFRARIKGLSSFDKVSTVGTSAVAVYDA